MAFFRNNNSFIIHETAIVEKNVKLASGVRVWAFAHIRQGASLGENVMVGESVYIGPSVEIGANSKIQNHAQIYEPAEIGSGVFIGPATVLTNDRIPRSVNIDGVLKKAKDWNPGKILIEDGASLGACVVCVAPVLIGGFSMVAAGAVVNRDVLAFERVAGNPIRNIGWSCMCGNKLYRLKGNFLQCENCENKYKMGKLGIEKK